MRAQYLGAFVVIWAAGCNLFQESQRPTAEPRGYDDIAVADTSLDMTATDAVAGIGRPAVSDLGASLDLSIADADAPDSADLPDLRAGRLPPALIAYDFEAVVAGVVPDVSTDGSYPLSFDGLVEIGNGHATFEGGALTSVEPTSFYDAVAESNAFAVSLWLRTTQREQGLLADEATSKRLLTLSRNSGQRDFTIAQLDDNVMLRLSTTGNSPNGTPSSLIDNAFDETLQHHFVQVEPDRMRYWVDGVLSFEGWPGGTIDWIGYDLMLGGEFDSDRIWAGELHDVRIWGEAFDDATIADIHVYGVPGPDTP